MARVCERNSASWAAARFANKGKGANGRQLVANAYQLIKIIAYFFALALPQGNCRCLAPSLSGCECVCVCLRICLCAEVLFIASVTLYPHHLYQFEANSCHMRAAGAAASRRPVSLCTRWD